MATFEKRIWNQIYPLKKKIFIYLPRDIESLLKSTTEKGYCCQSNCRHCPYGFDPKLGNLAQFLFNFTKIIMKRVYLLLLLLY